MSKVGQRLNQVFSPTGNIMQWLSTAADFLLIGLLWIACCIPIFTVGAASAALSSMAFQLLHGEEGGIVSGFFKAFRRFFGLATRLWLAALALGIFLILDLYFYLMWSAAGGMIGTILFSIFAAATILYICVMLYLFPYITRFQGNFRTAVKNSAYMSFRHLPTTLLLAAIRIGLILLCLFFPIGFVMLPGILAAVDGALLERVFSRYLSGESDEPEKEDNP